MYRRDLVIDTRARGYYGAYAPRQFFAYGKTFEDYCRIAHLNSFLTASAPVYRAVHAPDRKAILLAGFLSRYPTSMVELVNPANVRTRPAVTFTNLTSYGGNLLLEYESDYDYIPAMEFIGGEPFGIRYQHPGNSTWTWLGPPNTPVVMPGADILSSFPAIADTEASVVRFVSPFWFTGVASVLADGVSKTPTWVDRVATFPYSTTPPETLEFTATNLRGVSVTRTYPIYPRNKLPAFSDALYATNRALNFQFAERPMLYSDPPRVLDAAFARDTRQLVVLVNTNTEEISDVEITYKLVGQPEQSTTQSMSPLQTGPSSENTDNYRLVCTIATGVEVVEWMTIRILGDSAAIGYGGSPVDTGYFVANRETGLLRVRLVRTVAAVMDQQEIKLSHYPSKHLVLPTALSGVGPGGPVDYPIMTGAHVPLHPQFSFMQFDVGFGIFGDAALEDHLTLHDGTLFWSDGTTTTVSPGTFVSGLSTTNKILTTMQYSVTSTWSNQTSYLGSYPGTTMPIDGYWWIRNLQHAWPEHAELYSGYRQRTV